MAFLRAIASTLAPHDTPRTIMRVITITTFFPNCAQPQRTVFVKNLVQAMRQHCTMQVIAPVPYAPPFGSKLEWQASRKIPASEIVDGIAIEHPRFIVVPKIEWLSGLTYFLRILPLLARFRSEKNQVIIHVHCAYPDAVGVALAAKLLGLRYVVTAHGSDINVYAERPMLRFQIRWALQYAAGIVAVSESLEAKIRALVGQKKTEITRIPCAAFDPQVFSPMTSASHDATMQGRTVLFVGLLVSIKGIDYLIEAWAELHSHGKLRVTDQLVVLGDGPLRDTLERQVTDAKLTSMVKFTGTVNQTQVAQWIKKSDLLCLPSLNEGTPNVIIEAMACGVPVVASRVGGIPDLIHEGENGMLVTPQDSLALAEAMEAALNHNWNAETIARSVAGRTWQTIAEQNVQFIQSLFHDHDAIC